MPTRRIDSVRAAADEVLDLEEGLQGEFASLRQFGTSLEQELKRLAERDQIRA
jgi:hypothetical protein